MPWKCPHCGYDNAASAALCNLCGEMRPRPEPPPPTPAPPPPPAPEPPAEAWKPPADPGANAWNTAPGGGQWAKPPAGAWQQPPPAPPRGPGCEVLIEFVLLLPLSLFVFALPGGLRNRSARTLLRVMLLAAVVIGLFAIPTILRLVAQLAASAQGAAAE